MKILAPFDNVREVELLIRAGVSELYCGFRNEFWQKKEAFTSIKVGAYGNITSFQELKESVDIACKYDVPIFFCANMHASDGVFNHLIEDIKEAISLGVQGFVIVDLAIIPIIRRMSSTCKIILSSKEPALNSEHLKFFKELGVDSIFLSPRNMTVIEIKELLEESRAIGLEVEMFINDVGCRNITSMCQYRCFGMRWFYKEGIRRWLKIKKELLRYVSKVFPIRVRSRIYQEYSFPYEIFSYPCHDQFSAHVYKKNDGVYTLEKQVCDIAPPDIVTLPYCGLCDIYLFHEFDIRSVKLAGRGAPTKKKIKAATMTKCYVDQIEKGEIDDSNFIEKGQALYKSFFGKVCTRNQCYHLMSGHEGKRDGHEHN